METLTYQPPLRSAAVWAINLGRGAVPPETLATLAQVRLDRARSFARILVKCGVCQETPQGLVRGPQWEAWCRRPVRSRPRRSAHHQDALAQMEAIRRTIRTRLRSALEKRGWSQRELARRSGIHRAVIDECLLYAAPPPVCQLALIARALGVAVDDLVGTGGITC